MMRLLTYLLFALTAAAAAAVDVPWPDREVWPQSPQARQIAQVMMPTPALLTGACEYSVPLYTIEAEGVSIPLSLQYRSNGIRVDDDPQPVGYGWALTPPVRVIRQIMGRPDEWFPFKGEESGFDDYVKAYRSITQYDALTIAGVDSVNRYDTERDFFTIYLPDVSLTVVRIDGQFVGAQCDEYKIEGDTRLTYIKVTDPRGIVYNFNVEGEYMGETVLRTEWLLGQIVLPSGRSIDFTWIRNNHYAHGMSGFAGTFMRYNNEAPFSYCPEPTVGNYGKLASYCNTHDLKAIDFPGGKVSFEYSPEEDLIRMLQRVVVTSGHKTVFTARLLRSYTDLQRHLLGGLEVEGVGTYSFSYNPITFNTNNTCDWWGFYNGIASDDYIRSPGFTLKVGGESRFASNENLRGSDRSVDTVMMQANILERVVAPTGGIITWEYEPHHFPEQRSTAAWVTDRMDEPALSYGGGLRVKLAAPAANGSISLACDSAWVSTHYDAVGRVRGIGSGRNTFTDIAYDVHGWQTSRVYHTSAGNLNELLLYANGSYPRYNGNISSKICTDYRYDYRYDEYNRLIAANYHGIGSSGQDFSTAYSYDQRGNITHLQRKGVVMRLPSGALQFGVLDNVSTQYAGNQLVAIVNPAQGGNFEGRTGVGVMPAKEITYDFAGRILSDESRGIDRIYYDNDGHPVRIDFTAGHRHLLTYDGLGRLMSVAYFQQVSSAAGTGTYTHLQRTCVRRYTGAGHVIDNDSVKMTRFPGGYLDRGGNAFYYLTDYQGNNIAVVDAAGAITQRTYYYPYGEPWRYPDGQQYLFSDKELTRADGRHAYTFPARTLLSSLPRWTTPDPLAEQTPWDSPYAYCATNPIMAIDPSGCDSITINEQGQLLGSIKSTENDTFIIQNSQGNVINRNTFEYGTLLSITNTEYQEQKISIYNVNNDNNGIALFEFLADNTKVEWSLFQTGFESDGDNYITTSNNEYSDYGAKYLPYYYFTNFRSCIHNHPSNTAVPSPADISYAGWITKYFGWNISLSIYLPLYGRYIFYGPYSKKEDFEDAAFRQIIKTIVVEPK